MKILNYLNISELSYEIKKNDLFLNIIFISAIILPFSFYLGPAVIEVLIFLICISYLWIVAKKKEKISFNILIFFFFSFYIFLILSSVLSNSVLISLKSSLSLIRFAILTFAIIYIIKKSNFFLKIFFISIFLSISLIVISGFIQFLFSKDYFIISKLIYNTSAKTTVVSSFFGEEKKLGSFIARLSPLILGLYFFVSKNEMNKKINSSIFFFIPLYLINFLTAERMGMIYLSITLFFLFILSIKNEKKNIYKFFIFIIIPFLLFFAKINEFHLTVKNSYNQLFNEGKINYFSKQHKVFAVTSLELFKKNPILGVGPNNYRRDCATVKLEKLENNCSTHPHNILFQIIAETGTLGILFYLTLNLFFFLKIIKFILAKKYEEIELFLLLPIFYYMNPFFPSGNFLNNWYATIGLISLPFYIYISNKKNSEK